MLEFFQAKSYTDAALQARARRFTPSLTAPEFNLGPTSKTRGSGFRANTERSTTSTHLVQVFFRQTPPILDEPTRCTTQQSSTRERKSGKIKKRIWQADFFQNYEKIDKKAAKIKKGWQKRWKKKLEDEQIDSYARPFPVVILKVCNC